MYSTGHFLCLYSTVPFTWGETLTVTTNQMLVSFGCGCGVPRETKQAIMREIQFEGLSTLLDETLAVPLFAQLRTSHENSLQGSYCGLSHYHAVALKMAHCVQATTVMRLFFGIFLTGLDFI